MYRDFQARLARIQEPLKRRLKDNTIELAGVPVDTIRISYKKNDEGDITSRIIEKATVDQIIWPPLKNIPFRRLGKDGEKGYKITSLVESATDEKTAEIYKIVCTHGSKIDVGDILVRVFLDDEMDEPIVLVLKVAEVTGDFGTYMLINQQCKCVLETEDFDQKTLDIIGKMAERRLNVNF